MKPTDPDPGSTNPPREAVAVAVMEPDPPPPTPRQVIHAVIYELVQTTGRLGHHGKVAWTAARNIAPTVVADQAIVRNELAQARGDRTSIKRVAAVATNALVGIRTAVTDAAVIAGRAEALILEQRMRIKDSQTATTVDQAEFAAALAEDIQRLQVPLMELGAARDEARLRQHIIEGALQRRIHSTAIVAFESFVAEISDRLGELKAQVEAVHTRASVPDPIIAACLAVMDLLKLDPIPLPTLVLPKWSSAGSKNPKGSWTGDMFAPPTLTPV